MARFDAPFYIGELDIYDFQRKTGYKRWNTWIAAQAVSLED